MAGRDDSERMSLQKCLALVTMKVEVGGRAEREWD